MISKSSYTVYFKSADKIPGIIQFSADADYAVEFLTLKVGEVIDLHRKVYIRASHFHYY
jgi:hypothetical protein